MRRRVWVVFGGFLALTFAVLVWIGDAGAAEQVFKWRAQGFFAGGAGQNEVNKKWVEEVKKMTNGRLDITFFAAGDIVPTIEAWEACSRGVFEVMFDWSGYWTGKTVMAGWATGLPYTMRHASDYIALLRGFGLQDMLRNAYAKHNLYLVSTFPVHTQVFMSKFPVTKVADFKGKKIRSAGFMADLLAEAGASPVFLPMGETYGALERGLVDGTTMAAYVQANNGIPEVTKYLLMTPINPIEAQNVIVNQKAWNSLPDDLKMILTHSASNLGERLMAYAFTEDLKALKKMRAQGIKMTYLPDDEISKLAGFMVKVLDKYDKKDPEFAKTSTMVKEYMKAVGLLK